MALLDEKRDMFVVRIAYDGPPFSGKTTTLRSLSDGLARTLETPQEHDGRTLFFDWLDYTAGRFEGRPIRCQVVSVPGQRSLSERRRKLLADADAVVFVADTGRLGMDLSLKYAAELAAIIASQAQPRPGVVIQANKRDVADALPIAQVTEKFRGVGIDGALVETTATGGSGVREAFLFGVRLALDRIRTLKAAGALLKGSPEIDSSNDLLEQISKVQLTAADNAPTSTARSASAPPMRETPAVQSTPQTPAPAANVFAEALSTALRSEQQTSNGDVVINAMSSDSSLPDPAAPSGFIWPPIEGRIMVQQALSDAQVRKQLSESKHRHIYTEGGWHIHSRAQDWFKNQNEARTALLAWVRLHMRNQSVLSDKRTIVLSPDGEGLRLWQIVRTTRSLAETLPKQPVDAQAAPQIASSLMTVSCALMSAAEIFNQASMPLPLTLETVSADLQSPRYVGLAPGFDCGEPAIASRRKTADTEETIASLVSDAMLALTPTGENRKPLAGEFELIGRRLPEKGSIARALASVALNGKVS